MSTPPVKVGRPTGLGRSGRELWRDIAEADRWQLRPDELRILGDACRLADSIATLETAMEGQETLIQGARPGQMVLNPIITEIRMCRSTMATLLKQLKLPDEVNTTQTRSFGARQAAAARWQKTS